MAEAVKALSRAQIDAVDDQIVHRVKIDGWRGEGILQGLNGDGLYEFERILELNKGSDARANQEDARVRLIAMCLVDEDGNRLYSDSPADLAALRKKSGKVLQQLYGACMDINGYTKHDLEAMTAPNPFAPTNASSSGSA